MSKLSPCRLAFLPVAVMAVAVLVTGAVTAEPSPEAARLDSFSRADGENYFALSLRPAEAVAAAGPHDVVLLLDTSASQTGPYRAEALAALEATLANLTAQDRVHLVAVDVNAIAMTETFVASDGPAMSEALKGLKAREPLGATDMKKALTAAADSYVGDTGGARAVIYIGDGMSPANLLAADEFDELIGSLVDKRIAVSSYAVGPRLDVALLGALAGRTGGMVVDESDGAGKELAAAAKGLVLWPESVTWPAGFSEIYPKRTPPLRTDRDSVVIGTYKGEGPFDVEMTVDVAGEPKTLSWQVAANPPEPSNGYLAQLVETARLDGGLGLPIVGSETLREANTAVEVGVFNMGQLARQALNTGDLDSAERLAREVLRQNPQDTEAREIRAAAEGRRGAAQAGPAAMAAGPDDLNLVGPGGPAAADPLAAEGAFVDAVERERRMIEQMITAEVVNTVSQARGAVSADPGAAIQNLKLQLDSVQRSPDLNPEVRNQLVDQIQAALREASRREVEQTEKRRVRLENLAAAKEQMLINDNLLQKQQKMRQLIERFNSLMEEGHFTLAEDVAIEAQQVDEQERVVASATIHARTEGNLDKGIKMRMERQRLVLATLWEVEKSHIPFPDEPPIIWPDAEVWQRLTASRKKRYEVMHLAERGSNEEKIIEQLDRPTELEFFEQPLIDVIDYLKELHEIEIQLDTRALEEVGVDSQTPITKNLTGISLRSAFNLMLKDYDLKYVIDDEVLLITTRDEAETPERLATKVYPVADLVIPVQSMGGMGGGMMGGGMMGGGMMGGGMMGGGMGGMGMGGGGYGGGGMGGGGMGMFNVPQNILPKVPPGGFQAFCVEDDLSIPAQAEASPSAAEATTETTSQLRKIANAICKGDAEVDWDKHFRAHEEPDAAVRYAVRRLMNAQKFDHVIALMQAALRHGQPQSWMYEAMALAMQADGRPKDQIERAVMSAVDFAAGSLDLMYLGAYLERLGLEDRALQIYRQVADLEPVQPEPYVYGLGVAQKLDDIEGIQWATVGILSQAWPNAQAEVWRNAIRVAVATLARLREEKRLKEADQFDAALVEAIRRDCVVKVSWTGDADVDLIVEEPSGTICSFRNPRTTGGGVMLGDTSSQMGRQGAEGFSEVYVCPKGFSGRYRMLIRRVWGGVTADKVKVEVYTHYMPKNASDVQKTISLAGDEAVVEFELADGRRKESLAQQQVANAAIGQLAVRREILAQQIAGGFDPGSMASLTQSRQSAGRAFPFFSQGAVGYQPVIITLPEGANLFATAVISADRRYVRISPMPMFSGIAEVNVFNTASGANTQGRGGTGGQGFSGMMGGGGMGGGMGGMGGGMGGMGGGMGGMGGGFF